jgi:hypothetical protein
MGVNSSCIDYLDPLKVILFTVASILLNPLV